MQIEYIKILRK